MADPVPLEELAASLRRTFDASFATPLADAGGETVGMLAVRMAAEEWLVPLGDVTGLHADLVVSAVPGASAHLRGIAGIGGRVIAVYDLASLLALAAPAAARWVLTLKGAAAALAVEELEGHRRVPVSAIRPEPPATRSHVAGFVESDAGTRPIVSVPSVLQWVTRRAEAAHDKERN